MELWCIVFVLPLLSIVNERWLAMMNKVKTNSFKVLRLLGLALKSSRGENGLKLGGVSKIQGLGH